MKKTTRILALILALAALLCLGACGKTQENFETRMRSTQETMGSLESVHMEMNMNVTMELSMMGYSQEMDVKATYSIDSNEKDGKAHIEMTTEAMGTRQTISSYSEKVGDELVTYMSTDGGRSWKKQSVSGIQVPQDPNQITELFIRNADNFMVDGSETINGSKCTVYKGTLGEDYIQDVLELSGMNDNLNSILAGAGMTDLFKDLGDIPMTVAIDDETGYMIRYTMDMTELMGRMMEKVFNAAMESSGVSGAEITVNVTRAESTATMSQFNAVGDIVIPDEAKAA